VSAAKVSEHLDAPTPSPFKDDTAGAQPRPRKAPPTLWQRAAYRWTAITAVMATLLLLYTQHPYYQGNQFTPFRTVYPAAFVLWLALGLFYCKATVAKFGTPRYAVRDGGLHLVLLARIVSDGRQLRGRALVYFVPALVAALARSTLLPGWQSIHAALNAWPTLTTLLYMPITALAVVGVADFVRPIFSQRFRRAVKNRRVRTTLLLIIVKGFFTPLMIGFFCGHANAIVDAWLRHKHAAPFRFTVPHGTAISQASAWWEFVKARIPDLVPRGSDFAGLFAPSTWTRADVSWAIQLAYDFVFFVDCGMALIGYSTESRWLGNKTRSVEPTALGWTVCLACYPPFNNVLGTYLPLESGPQHFTETTQLVLRGLVVALFTIYASATVAFGLRFSNLTNRGIISRGPYRYVRHPAYLTKCTAWWFEHLPTITLTKAFFLTLLCAVYALRAWTEERHLGMDPEYREYKKKVPWVIFPGFY